MRAHWIAASVAACFTAANAFAACSPDIKGTLSFESAKDVWPPIVVCTDAGTWSKAQWRGAGGDATTAGSTGTVRLAGGSEDIKVPMSRIVQLSVMEGHPEGKAALAAMAKAEADTKAKTDKANAATAAWVDLSQDTDAWPKIKQGFIDGHNFLRADYKALLKKAYEDAGQGDLAASQYGKVGGDGYAVTLAWDQSLADGAQTWANHLAEKIALPFLKAGKDQGGAKHPPLVHDPKGGIENIAAYTYRKAAPKDSAYQATANKEDTGSWGQEIHLVDLTNGAEPQNCKDADPAACGHYNSIVHKDVTSVGCGVALATRKDRADFPVTYWVCRYRK